VEAFTMHANRPVGMAGRTPEAHGPARDAGRHETQNNIADGPNGTVFGVMGGGSINIHHGGIGGAGEPAADHEGRIRVLLLAANPARTRRLAIDEEAREITEKVRLSRDRDAFDLITRWAVRPADLLQYLNEHRPHVVHFSGHGDPAGEIVLSAGGGDDRRVDPAALAELFRVMKDDIRVVVLNACYSAVQARAIGQHIDYIIGMRARVGDEAAIVFAAAFYSALGFRRTVPQAFEQATTALMLHGMAGHDVPELIVRPGADLSFKIGR
jgi:hypothetical protein